MINNKFYKIEFSISILWKYKRTYEYEHLSAHARALRYRGFAHAGFSSGARDGVDVPSLVLPSDLDDGCVIGGVLRRVGRGAGCLLLLAGHDDVV